MPQRFALVLVNGPEIGAFVETGAEDGPLTIGRDDSRDLPIDDHRASRLHARVSCHGGQWQVEDCGSRNGTFLNGKPVERAVLAPGDLIRIGDRLIIFSDVSGGTHGGELTPTRLPTTTFVLRMPESDKQNPYYAPQVNDSEPAFARRSVVLCRLADRLQRAETVAAINRHVADALADGADAKCVHLWLSGPDGRLKMEIARPELSRGKPSPLLASLAIENNEAALVDLSSQSETADGADHSSSHDTAGNSPVDGSTPRAMAVPIPGRTAPRGAVECRRNDEQGPFAVEDLEFSIAVAQQAGLALENLEHRLRIEQANEQMRERLDSQTRLVGESTVIDELRERIARVASVESAVLILGESGTGKELVAEMVHALSRRSAGPFVAVNCAAFSESLLESELFGHEAGAFTGASRRRAGQFERADRGTIFLDEVGEMSPSCQAKLLRLLEGQPFERLGGEETVDVDVRIVAATHRDLAALVDKQQFRADLYFRLRVIELAVPPLRERGDDILQLARWFLEETRIKTGRGPQRLSAAAAAAIIGYPWPGNVRELKNAIERGVVLGVGDEMTVHDLALGTSMTATTPSTGRLAEAERRHIEAVLQSVGGNKTKACKILGIGRATLYKKLASFDEAPET